MGERAKLKPGRGVPRNTGKVGTTPDDMAQMYQRLDMMAVIFDGDHETRTGVTMSNADFCSAPIFPVLTPERWLAEFAGLPSKETLRAEILTPQHREASSVLMIGLE